MTFKKISISLLTLLLLIVAAWLAASIYVGRTTEKWVGSLVEQTTKQKKIRLVNVKHQQSLLTSQGQFEIRFNDIGTDLETGKQKFAVLVDYSISNLLLPASSMRFTWNMKPTGEYGVEVNRLFGSELAFNGKGQLGWGGRALTSLNMPELVMRDGQDRLQISPSAGHFSWAGQTIAFDWKTDKIAMMTEGRPLDVTGISAKGDVSNRSRGTGTFEFSVDKVSTKEGTAEGFSVQTAVLERGDRFDLSIQHKLASVSAAGQKIRDVVLDVALSGLDMTSIETLTTIANDSDDFQSLTADEQTRGKTALSKLIAQGFTFSLPKISAQVNAGSINGDLKIEFLKSAAQNSTTFSAADSIRAAGQLLAKGKVVDQAQKMMAVMMGLATDSKDGLKASFEFSGKTFKANGKNRDVSDQLSLIDGYINGLIAP